MIGTAVSFVGEDKVSRVGVIFDTRIDGNKAIHKIVVPSQGVFEAIGGECYKWGGPIPENG